MSPLAILRMTHDGVGRDFIRQPFLSCWLKIQNYQKLAREVKLSFRYELSFSVYGMTKLNFWDQLSISEYSINLGAVFGIRK